MSTIFEDDFNSYSCSDLYNQDSWTGGNAGKFFVQDAVVAEGTRGVICSDVASYHNVVKIGTALTSGQITFYARAAGYPTTRFDVRIGSSASWQKGAFIYFTPSKIQISGNDIQSYSLDTWYCVEVQWRNSPDYKCRARVNGQLTGGWTSWYAGYMSGTWVAGLNQVGLYKSSTNTHAFYIDHIAEEPISNPTTTITANPSGLTNSTTATFEFTSDQTEATFETNLDSAGWETNTSPKVYTELSDGAHNFKVRAVGIIGNPDLTPEEFDWEIDTDPPQSTITEYPSDPSIPDVHFAFTADESDCTFETRLDSESWEVCLTSDIDYIGLSAVEHNFYVRATDPAGNLEPSPPNYWWHVEIPEAPYNYLTWTDTSGDEDGFKIERKVGEGTWSLLTIVGADASDYHDTDVTSGVYYYRVYAYNGVGDSSYSNIASDLIGELPIPAPSNLTVTLQRD